MTDIAKINGGECDDDDCEKGERGRRGHRGHRGHSGRDGETGPTGPSGSGGPSSFTGPTGPTGTAGGTGATGPAGPTGSGGTTTGRMLKFASALDPALPSAVGYVPDGTGDTESAPVSYPVPSPRTFVSFFAELEDFVGGPNDGDPFSVPVDGRVEFRLFHNGIAVPTFVVIFVEGMTGISFAAAPVPELMSIGDTFYVQVTSIGFDLPSNVRFSFAVTIGVA